jgi:NAD+ kinase
MAAKKKPKKKGLSILLVAKQNKAGIKHVKEAERLLRRYTDEIHLDKSTAFRFRKRGMPIRKFKGDLIVTIGGDGTFLITAHHANVPILPVRIEGKGFLCTTDWKDFKKYYPRLFKKKYTIAERLRIKAVKMPTDSISKYLDRLHKKDYPMAVNEIAFARKRPSKLLNIEVTVDDVTFSMMGDGVMISTPSGSTAYSASAGGSIIDPKLSVLNIIPLYPFYSKVKPIVIPSDKKIVISVRGGDCCLVVDGHGGDYFKENSHFVIEKSKPAKIIYFEEPKFFERVKKDLFEQKI